MYARIRMWLLIALALVVLGAVGYNFLPQTVESGILAGSGDCGYVIFHISSKMDDPYCKTEPTEETALLGATVIPTNTISTPIKPQIFATRTPKPEEDKPVRVIETLIPTDQPTETSPEVSETPEPNDPPEPTETVKPPKPEKECHNKNSGRDGTPDECNAGGGQEKHDTLFLPLLLTWLNI